MILTQPFIRVLFQSTTDRELWTFANLNLAIVYLRMKREGDFNKLIENINPETLPSHSHSLRAAAFYVQGLQCFFQARYNEAKYVKAIKLIFFKYFKHSSVFSFME